MNGGHFVKLHAKTNFGAFELDFGLKRPDPELCGKLFNSFRDEASFSELCGLLPLPDGAEIMSMEVRICRGSKVMRKKTICNTDKRTPKA